MENPTLNIDLNFSSYLQNRSSELSAHLVDGVPDYAFSLDEKLRSSLAAMGPVRAIAKSLVSFAVPFYKQIQNMQAVAVSPQQYPQIYAVGEDCAKRLGIGIPQIFVYFSPVLNGYTIATDNVAPMIVLSSALVEALSEQELKFVIGHECGHIHNL
ncbi:MAG: M48 family metalloprotease, partial [Calothrix sp. SM1_7_51]|nr:M48 family metalloprotease [Calothrix sp. SM1_7_51]